MARPSRLPIGTAAVVVDGVERLPVRNRGGPDIVLEDEREGCDAVPARDGNHAGQHVNVTEFRCAHVGVGQRGVMIILQVRDAVVAAVESRGRRHAAPVRFVSVGEGEHRRHAGPLAHVVKQCIEVLPGQRRDADGHADHGGLRGEGLGRGLGAQERFGGQLGQAGHGDRDTSRRRGLQGFTTSWKTG